MSCRKSTVPQAPRTGRPVVLPKRPRQLTCEAALRLCRSAGAQLQLQAARNVARRRLLDGVIERRQHASRQQTAHLQRSTRAHRTRAAAVAGETQAKCATGTSRGDGRRDAHERRTADRPARLMKRRKTRARKKKLCMRVFSNKNKKRKTKKRRLTSRRVRYFRIRESYH